MGLNQRESFVTNQVQQDLSTFQLLKEWNHKFRLIQTIDTSSSSILQFPEECCLKVDSLLKKLEMTSCLTSQ